MEERSWNKKKAEIVTWKETQMAEQFKGKMNVAVLVAGPAAEEHDALLHKALLIEKELAKVANVSILGKKLNFIIVWL